MYATQSLSFKTTKRGFPTFRLFLFGVVVFLVTCFSYFLSTNQNWTDKKRRFEFIYEENGFGKRRFNTPIDGDEAANFDDVLLNYDTLNKILASLPYVSRKKFFKKKFVFKNSTRRENFQSSIEHDPTIDENAVPQSYKFFLNKQPRVTECNSENPVKNLVFLRSHRTGSHTISNIFYRYGDHNNLFFALPNAPTFQYYWPLRFHHSYIAKNLLNKAAPNFMINVARNSKHNIHSAVAKNAVKIAVVRNPVTHFQSIYEYVDVSFFMRDINTNTSQFSDFVQNPAMYIRKIMNTSNMFDPVFHLLKNGQLFDLGYEDDDYKTELQLKFIVDELDAQLDMVLLDEYIDESLVLLQRLLCWQLSDMVYIKQRVRKQRNNITKVDGDAILKWNQADSYMYNYFNKTLWERINHQDESFWEDVKELKYLVNSVKEECLEPNRDFSSTTSLPISSSDKYKEKVMFRNSSEDTTVKNAFEVVNVLHQQIQVEMEPLCKRLVLSERDYIKILKDKQKQNIADEHKSMISSKYITNSTEGNFFYSVTNKTAITNTTKDSMNDELGENEDENEDEPKEILFGG
ncbi:uncharacterized protein LOC130647730 [Hydractinia symbiolongicarpus]|uniref:uncharacterized protein LOC130647730 n=1 Tax=Hydractinia symbiolongicarpus TaxID=13093 RepID=UPI00254CB3E0|nr:uncharacterized protein LOC130647730 [Hydractinia symbiolongicarpus]